MADDDDLGLTEREKELKRWNKPYVYQEFPKAVHRVTVGSSAPAAPTWMQNVTTLTENGMTYQSGGVATAGEEALATADGWFDQVQAATEAANTTLREQQDRERHAAQEQQDREHQAAERHQAEVIDQAVAKALAQVREAAHRQTEELREAIRAREEALREAIREERGERRDEHLPRQPKNPRRAVPPVQAPSTSDAETPALEEDQAARKPAVESKADLIKRRATLLADYKQATGVRKDKHIYENRKLGIHKPQFYQWRKGELPAESQTAINFERFLVEAKPPPTTP